MNFLGSDAISIFPQFSMENDDQALDFDQNPPFKRSRISEETQPNNINNLNLNLNLNKASNNIFFKTRLCVKFKNGMCRNGDDCNFAHGIDDVRQPPPNWQEMVGLRPSPASAAFAGETDDGRRSPPGNWDDDQKIILRMKLCKKYNAGEECPYGDRCNFLHEEPAKFRDDSGRFRESSAISIGTSSNLMISVSQGTQGSCVAGGFSGGGGGCGGGDGLGNLVKPVYWKTKLCNKWEQTGHCPFGEKCHFAHGFPGTSQSALHNLQASSGRVEFETMSVVGSLTTKPQISSSDARSPGSTNVGGFNEELKSKKCLLKWKGLKKINRIYGDWLDDLPLSHNIPSRVET